MKKVIETPANKNSMMKDEHHKTLFSVTHTKTLFSVTDTSVSLYGVETFLSVFQRCSLVTGFTNARQSSFDRQNLVRVCLPINVKLKLTLALIACYQV